MLEKEFKPLIQSLRNPDGELEKILQHDGNNNICKKVDAI
jgi:hypothetical protein